MVKTYVTGHRNPDTDSIVSAIAYAQLKNALGERDVIAVRLGDLTSETEAVLKRFGFSAPPLITNVKTQLSDVRFDTPPIVGESVTLRTAWDIMIEHKVQLMAIADEDCKLAGVLYSNDIAEYDMRSVLDELKVDTTAFNLASSLDGILATGNELEKISGIIRIAVHDIDFITAERFGGCVLVAGNQRDIVNTAHAVGVSCLVLCQVDAGTPVALEAGDADFPVILTHMDPYRAARMMLHSISVSKLMRKDGIVFFHEDDFLDDVRVKMQKNREPCYPVLNAKGRVLGTVSRYHLLNHDRKRVILVDHNESGQSVPGLEQAELLEIIDHHRIADLQTRTPVYFRGEPVGSATTLVASLFFENGVTPTRSLAGLIAAGIISDTVMFKSPTCTEKDRRMAQRMVQLAGIDIDELVKLMFSAAAAVSDKDAKDILAQDFKEFVLGVHKVGIGQVTCMDVADIEHLETELLECMHQMRKERNCDIVMMMLTQIINEGTKLLFIGKDAEEFISRAFGVSVEQNYVFLPGVMSRKKQIVPPMSAVLA